VAALQDPAPDVRAGDIYALLVDWCCQQGNIQQALQLIQQMADNGLQPQAFLSDAAMAQVQQVGGLGWVIGSAHLRWAVAAVGRCLSKVGPRVLLLGPSSSVSQVGAVVARPAPNNSDLGCLLASVLLKSSVLNPCTVQ
jgi:pentatricopeptide repeat protein